MKILLFEAVVKVKVKLQRTLTVAGTSSLR